MLDTTVFKYGKERDYMYCVSYSYAPPGLRVRVGVGETSID
jgi:hypothetical protein